MRWVRFTASAGLLVALGATLAACGQSDEAKAQDYAVTACGIYFDDSGAVFDDADTSVDPATIQFSRLQEIADDEISSSTAAAAAAQLDSSWTALARSTTDMSITSEKAVELRKYGSMNSDFWEQYPDTYRSLRTSSIAAKQVECRALAARLSD